MYFNSILLLASSAALAAAAPTPITVGADDVILYGKGRFTMMKRSDLEELEALRKSGIVPPKPGYLEESMYTVWGNETRRPSQDLTKRGGHTILIPNAGTRFLGWDTPMSAVVRGSPTDISVSSGYTVGNSITVGAGAEFGPIEKFLSVSLKIDYTHSWESTQTQLFRATVPADKYGAFVSNAWTNRQSGYVWRGDIGGEGSLTYYQADSFESRGYGDLSWVDGVISLCIGDVYPLQRCLGEGNL